MDKSEAHSPLTERSDPSRIGRRTFLKVTGAVAAATTTGLTGILESGRAPAYAQGAKLHIVRWVDFVPDSDAVLKQQMGEASKDLGAEVTLETINANDLQPRITAAIQSGSGADIFMLEYNWAQLYANGLADVSDVAESLAKAEGGFYPIFAPCDHVGGKWLAVPHSIIGNAIAYRKSWLKAAGADHFPKTWQELDKVGAALKKAGHPVGQTLGHTFGDAPTFTYPLMWSYGAQETDKTGKKVVLQSKGAVDSVKFMTGFWKAACDEGGLAWDDTSNNRAFLSGSISATLNGASIYIAAKRQADKMMDEKGEPMWKDIDHALLPAGPAGQYMLFLNHQHAVMKYSKNQKLAKDLIRWMHKKENYKKWFDSQSGYSVGATTVWESDPMWKTLDPPLQLFRTAARTTRLFGYAGPSTAKSTEAFTKYIITDMYAKAVQGMAADEAVKWADGQLKQIYG